MKKANFTAVLDIAGFEIFEYNGFEQISISLSHSKDHAIAMAMTARKSFKILLIGRLINWLLAIRRKLFRSDLDRALAKI